jgi:hypothetical protein
LQREGRERCIDQAGQRPAQGEEDEDVAQLAQAQRLHDEAPDQPGAHAGLRHRTDADDGRQDEGRDGERAAVGTEDHIDGERAECHAGQHAPAEHQHAGQRNAGGGVQGGGIARRNREPERHPTDDGISERRAHEGQQPMRRRSL